MTRGEGVEALVLVLCHEGSPQPFDVGAGVVQLQRRIPLGELANLELLRRSSWSVRMWKRLFGQHHLGCERQLCL